MWKHFKESIIITAIGLIFAWFWAEHMHHGSGPVSLFIVAVLGILEVSLSFDNAVVNAMKLEHMSDKWRHRFLTWGIAIAVFGMRFLFPILIVALFAKVSMLAVAKMAVYDADKYAHYLHETHAPIVAFGGAFLIMLFLHYFLNPEKTVHWIKYPEEKLCLAGNIHGIETVITIGVIFLIQSHVAEEMRLHVVLSALTGVVLYLLIEGVSRFLEKKEAQRAAKMVDAAARTGGFVSFMYLELIDASFSLDGVLGAFALSKDIVIISIGLAIGAIFVRSLTILLVEEGTLKQFRYMEHGAHWAIGALAAIMFVSAFQKVSEVVTGLIGVVFIAAALISSIIYNKRQESETN
jgi:hypothetical protein